MRRLILAVTVLLLAAPAWSIDTNVYPSTLMDQSCTDANDVPAAETLALAYFNQSNVAAAVQTSGNPDGFCDNDSRIKTGAIAAVASFGPFSGVGVKGLYIFVDADTVTGGTTAWRVDLYGRKPHDGVAIIHDYSTGLTGTGDVIIVQGTDVGAASAADNSLDTGVPDIFYIKLALPGGGATSITADFSVVPYYEAY